MTGSGSIPHISSGIRLAQVTQYRDTGGTILAGLTIDVFNTGYRPVPSAIPIWPDGWPATWPATTSTLISGERDGVLVDTLATKGESQELADWLGTTGKNLTEVLAAGLVGGRSPDLPAPGARPRIRVREPAERALCPASRSRYAVHRLASACS